MEDLIDLESLEAMACREGLALASHLLMRHIRPATDCLGVVRSLRDGSLLGVVLVCLCCHVRSAPAAGGGECPPGGSAAAALWLHGGLVCSFLPCPVGYRL